MMLIICDKNPYIATNYLYHHTNKNFWFKQLLELAQLICSCGYSDVYKPIKQGKAIQAWIKDNKEWVAAYFSDLLYCYAYHQIKMKPKTFDDLQGIYNSINDETDYIEPKTAVFRFKQGYVCDYTTNSELPIETACNEYKKYLDWKFKSNG